MTLKKSVLMGLVIVLALGAIVQDVYSAQEKLDLKLNLKKGQKFGLKMVTDQKMSQTMMGQQQKMNQMTAIGMSFGPMGVMEYDSTKPQQPGADNPMSAMYKAMVGHSFVMKLTPKGEILEIKGIDEMIAKMIDKMAQRH